MAYTTPKTDWAAGDLVTASEMNRIGNNVAALKSPPTGHYEANQGSDYTTTSTSFANVDNTNFALTITTTGGGVQIGFMGQARNTSNLIYWDIELDGTRIGGDDGIMGGLDANNFYPVSFVYLKTGLSAGSHTFKLQWKVGGTTGTLAAGAATAGADTHPQFWVQER